MLHQLVGLLLGLQLATTTTTIPSSASRVSDIANHHNGTCPKFKNTFSEANAEVVRCAIDHAEPAQFCTGCVNHYLHFEMAWLDLVTRQDNQTNASCWTMYVDHDRLNLVLGVHEKTVQLWTGADCPNCFATNRSGQLTNHTTPAATDFYTKLASFDACIHAHTSNSTAIICTSCAGEYSDLNTHYTRFVQGSIAETDGVCFDLRDAMNRTRRSWSDDYKCCRDRHESLFAFVLSSLVIGSLPAVFYAVAVAMRLRRDGRDQVQLDARLEQSRRTQAATAAVVSLPQQPDATDDDDAADLLGNAQPMAQSHAANGAMKRPVASGGNDEDDDVSLLDGRGSGAVNTAAAIDDVLLDLGGDERSEASGMGTVAADASKGDRDDDSLLDLGGAQRPKAAVLVNQDDVDDDDEEEEEDEVAKWKRLSKEQNGKD